MERAARELLAVVSSSRSVSTSGYEAASTLKDAGLSAPFPLFDEIATRVPHLEAILDDRSGIYVTVSRADRRDAVRWLRENLDELDALVAERAHEKEALQKGVVGRRWLFELAAGAVLGVTLDRVLGQSLPDLELGISIENPPLPPRKGTKPFDEFGPYALTGQPGMYAHLLTNNDPLPIKIASMTAGTYEDVDENSYTFPAQSAPPLRVSPAFGTFLKQGESLMYVDSNPHHLNGTIYYETADCGPHCGDPHWITRGGRQ